MIRLLTGDVRDMLATLPDASVHTVVTSPPYYGLRDYGTAQWDGGDAGCDHGEAYRKRRNEQRGGDCGDGGIRRSERDPQTGVCSCGARRIDRQIGLESSPEAYLATMVQVFREVRRVLRDDGTCWVNMGDSYSGGKQGRADHGSGDPTSHLGPKRDGIPGGSTMPTAQRPVPNGYKSKDLLMMPARLALALQADGWWLRSDIIWAKPNPMPESVTDRPTSAHEHVFLLTKRSRYYYDADAVREDSQHPKEWLAGTAARYGAAVGSASYDPVRVPGANRERHLPPEGASRNLRNVWQIATAPFPAAHFATFPPELAERCIRAGTSERGCCAQCGKPWVRQTTRAFVSDGKSGARTVERQAVYSETRLGSDHGSWDVTTTGWSPGCQCNTHNSVVPCQRSTQCSWPACSQDCDGRPGRSSTPPIIPCTVLDPFSGAGTALLVADRLGRDAIGIDLSHAYVEMARERLQADCPLFADITDAPVASEDAYDRDMRDLFAEAAE